MAKEARPYDIVLWGVTGFTGKLVAEYFASSVVQRYPKLTWALCGRSRDKVQAVKEQLKAAGCTADPAVLTGDADDQASVDAVVAQCRVLLTTAGPYLKRGGPVVDACVRLGTHYVDITGETSWVAELIDKYHHLAEENGTFIVPMCGFDSIPADLGTLFAVKKIREMYAQPTRRVQGLVDMNGMLSGGTAATFIELGRDFPEHRRRQEYAFCMGGGTLPRPEDEDQVEAVFNEDLKVWTMPFGMASLNTRVVRRSNAWLHYGPDFGYNEAQIAMDETIAKNGSAKEKAMKKKAEEAWKVNARLRDEGRIPQQGDGPDAALRARSHFNYNLVGTAVDGRKLHVRVSGGDPGYTETAKMLSESALCLLMDRESLSRKGGVLTPAAAGGLVLVRRLQDAGIKFDLVQELPKGEVLSRL
eukprot:TRINITY_DN19050_c0_g1_i1.p1 TRINITY_DN19050_c0_g1~~TRINITY_DN19050_c0_g1_i1.p1  ORF type:complete len:416 (-),score=94.07 TRINITY_DN19050_c0_g1_i1:173-1420(-)